MGIIWTPPEKRFKWAGIPFMDRYSSTQKGPEDLVKRMRQIDDRLDLKFYLPKEQWHVVRYRGSRNGEFEKVWACEERPDLGLRPYVGDWIIPALRAGDLKGRDLAAELDEADKSLLASIAKEADDIGAEMAKEMRKPLIQLEEYGPNADYKGVY